MTKKKSFLVHFLPFIFFVIVSLFFISKDNQSSRYKQFLISALSFFQPSFINPFQYFSLKNENIVLQKKNLSLKLENTKLLQNKLQYERIENSFLKLKDEFKYNLLLAKVVAQSPSLYQFDWLINVGKLDLVTKNMPVLTHRGVIGKIKEVYDNLSVVQVIQDKNFKISVLSQNSRSVGIIKSYNEHLLAISFPLQVNIFPGDTLITSGLGQIFPKGFPVGIVSFQELETETRATRMFIVEPFENYSRVEEVFVYRKKEL